MKLVLIIKVSPGSVHNELILDDRYVLVDRGVYALKNNIIFKIENQYHHKMW